MSTKWTISLLLIGLLFTVFPLIAQDTLQNGNPIPAPEEANEMTSPLSSFEFYLSMAVLIFGFTIICLEIFLIWTRKISPEDTIKFVIITIIIIATLFLITAGYSNDQIAPAAGLLGTIAGYLLGRIQNPNGKEENN